MVQRAKPEANQRVISQPVVSKNFLDTDLKLETTAAEQT